MERSEQKLVQKFAQRDSFSRQELFEFYSAIDPELNENTFGWRVHYLLQRNVINQIKTGVYKIAVKPSYEPELSPLLIRIGRKIHKKFSYADHCIWESTALNEFSRHQTSRPVFIVEMDKYLAEPLFYEIKGSFSQDVYFNPTRKTMDLYVAESKSPIVVKNLISRSPTIKREVRNLIFHTPTLEKILVDIFSDVKTFYWVQGSERKTVFENAINKYTLNYSKLLNYAARRGKKEEIKAFMLKHFYELISNIIDD